MCSYVHVFRAFLIAQLKPEGFEVSRAGKAMLGFHQIEVRDVQFQIISHLFQLQISFGIIFSIVSFFLALARAYQSLSAWKYTRGLEFD